MRLLLLSEHTDKNDLYQEMWHDFLREQGRNQDSNQDSNQNRKQSNKQGHKHEKPPSHTQFLIEHAGAIIGLAELELEEECFPDEDLPEVCLKIHAFYITQASRDKNFGRQAFKLLRQWGRDNKAALLETEVSKALKFSNDFFKEQGLELAGSGASNIWRGFI